MKELTTERPSTQGPPSLVSSLREELESIEEQMMNLLDISTIEAFRNDPYGSVQIIASPYYWGKPDGHQKRLQMELKRQYSHWHERFMLLFLHAPRETQKQMEEAHVFVTAWIEKESGWFNQIPATIGEAKSIFKERLQSYYESLDLVDTPSKDKQLVLVPDTNVLIAEPDVATYRNVVGQANYEVIILPTVLSELDNLKTRHPNKDLRDKVRLAIKRIKGWRIQGKLSAGVTVDRTVTVRAVAQEPDFDHTLSWLDSGNRDDRILASVLELQRNEPSAALVLITNDINLQNKAEVAGIPFREAPADL